MKMDEEEFYKEWEYFCSKINFKDSWLDARAIRFMNEFKKHIPKGGHQVND